LLAPSGARAPACAGAAMPHPQLHRTRTAPAPAPAPHRTRTRTRRRRNAIAQCNPARPNCIANCHWRDSTMTRVDAPKHCRNY